jgi:hypothetical protein
MSSERTMKVVRAVYDEVNLALWATAVAFMVYFATFVAPKLPQLRAEVELTRLQQITAENEAYCAKWRMGPTTAMHNECLLDLQQLRANIENQLAEATEF